MSQEPYTKDGKTYQLPLSLTAHPESCEKAATQNGEEDPSQDRSQTARMRNNPRCFRFLPEVFKTKTKTAIHDVQKPKFADASNVDKTQTEDRTAIYIDWDHGDPGNPFNWSLVRKWSIVGVCIFYGGTTAIAATGYASTQEGAIQDLKTDRITFLCGSTTYFVAIAFAPLILAPLSELYGRRPIFMVACLLFTLMFLPQALAPNIASIVASRFFQGCAGSVGNSMITGSIADLFPSSERGLPMSIFCLSIYVFQSVGSVAGGWTTANSSLGWRWFFWWQGAVCLGSSIGMFLLEKESRGSVLLSRRAARLTKETGIPHRCTADDERRSFSTMLSDSAVRPILYLTTEPIVTALSLWIGFLWGCVFLVVESVPIAFDVYGWTSPQKASVLVVYSIGGFLGWLGNFHQDYLYRKAIAKYNGKPPPEARLYWSCAGAILAPVGMFWYGWGAQANVHPAVPIIGLIVFMTGTYVIYVAAFNYVADCYERYSSSGVAAQSCLRNMLAGTFSLFAPSMYERLTPPVASSVLAAIGAVLGVCPFVLMKYGSRIRSKSRIAQALEKEEVDSGAQLTKSGEISPGLDINAGTRSRMDQSEA